MSRAFVKEDVDEPERSTRVRSASGLPPGALNYMTASGQRRLRARLAELQADAQKNAAEIARLEAALESATVVDVPRGSTDTVSFGTIVQVRHASGAYQSFHIVGVDELEGEEGTVSWISPLGKALLGREVGDRVSLEDDGGKLVIVKIEYPEGEE